MRQNKQVLLASRPGSDLKEDNFRMTETAVPEVGPGQFLIENHYLSLDAGFRQWMNEGASDNYLTAMPLDAPVQSIVLGEVIESNNPDFPKGAVVMGRTAWEQYSLADGSDLMNVLEPAEGVPLYEYLAALGPSGMTAYFGLLDIGKPQQGDKVLVSAAAGGVGSIVGQLAKIKGCHTVGMSSSEEKCAWLKSELKYDSTVNHRADEGLSAQLDREFPEGIDIYFDNVGGAILNTAMAHLAQGARIVLCGAISQYDVDKEDGIFNMWELITKRARAEGFMFSDYIDRYPEAIAEMSQWIADGKLSSPVTMIEGIEHTAKAYCDMLNGKTRGKCLVKLG